MTGRIAIASLFCWFMAGPVQACPVCVDLPELTLADKVLGGKVVVLARPDPVNLFRYEVTEIVRDETGELAALPDIPFLVSTSARRSLTANPSHAILLSYGPRLDENGLNDGEGWHQMIRVTPERRPVIDRLLAEGENWLYALTTEESRFAFFADLLDHPDKVLVDTALAEISRAPYRLIRGAAEEVPAARLRARLTRIEELPYAPIAILLLGLSQDPEAQDYVRRMFGSALRRGSTNLDAWAVAGIEVDGAGAVDRIDRALGRGAITPERRADLILALTVTGTARPDLRPAIAPILHRESMLGAERAGAIAPTLYEWKDWTLTDHYRALLADAQLDPSTRYMLTVMVDAALNLIAPLDEG